MEGSENEESLINLIWAPFLDPDCVRSLSLGAIWNFCEGPGLSDLASEYGAQRACFQA